jgi:glycosyltransferase involved in cell wall biosynthesis
MTRVMLVCPEPLAHGQPAGVGIRFLEMARVLRDDGHAVTILSPDAGTIDGCAGTYINPQKLLSTSEASDVAIVQGHVANAFFMQAKTIPTVIDLYDPYVIENFHYYAERGAEVFEHDHRTLMASLQRGDYFLCASEAQRLFYAGLLLACGRLNPMLFESDPTLESLIGLAPFGVPPPRPPRAVPPSGTQILFGGVYDWYDPVAAIEVVGLVRASVPDATVTFTTHPNPAITPQGKLAEAIAHTRARGYDFVRFEPWVAYDQRGEFFERFTLALLTFPRSLETDLAMRTRIYDYLWCGLPIVTSSAPGTDELLQRYGAGSVLSDDTPSRAAAEVLSIALEPATHQGMVEGARRFVLDHQWRRTLEPLRAFCRAPRFEPSKDAFATAPFLSNRPFSILDRLKRRLRA